VLFKVVHLQSPNLLSHHLWSVHFSSYKKLCAGHFIVGGDALLTEIEYHESSPEDTEYSKENTIDPKVK
jgi:hypothetical protein